MSNNFRSIIFKKVIKPLQNKDNAYQHKILSQVNVRSIKEIDMYSFVVPTITKDYNVKDEVQSIMKNDSDNIFDDIVINSNSIYFYIKRDRYTKAILESNHSDVAPPILVDNNKNIIVEFSSPNIAKPFHLGTLRSTITGNYVANLNSFLQNKVKKINYLGDWGTQFGFIQVGLEIGNIDSKEIQANPINTLYKAYVSANTLAENDSTISDRARKIFKQLELEDDTILKNWQIFKNYTVQELEKTYKRISVDFDEYHWESMYTAKNTQQIINLMEKMQLLKVDAQNKKVIPLNETRNIPILKSDGSTLYITRDIAAAIDRFEKNNFDSMYYVVDNAQTHHFSNLVQILKKMELPWANRLKHIKFGRVRGMSTRKGTAVFLEDILNEARDAMRERQMHKHSTKVSLDETDNSSDILGVSGIIIHNLKQNRMKDYEFDWDLIFNMKGDTGIKLQYTHCRLISLEQTSGATVITECDPSLLKEAEVDDLIMLISKFDEVILKSYEKLEPCVLTAYLFKLSNAINTAVRKLKIRGEPSDLGNQRLLLFNTAKVVFAQGMKLLGLTPLEKM